MGSFLQLPPAHSNPYFVPAHPQPPANTHTPAPRAGSLLEMGWPPEPQPPGPPGHHSLVHWLPTDLRMHLLHGQMFIYDVARLLLPKDPAIETPKYPQRGQISVWIWPSSLISAGPLYLYLQVGPVHSTCNLPPTHVHQNYASDALPRHLTTLSFKKKSHTSPRLLPWSRLWKWHPPHWAERVDFIPLDRSMFLSCH